MLMSRHNSMWLYKANKSPTQHHLGKHGPGFSQIPVFVPADIEKSKDKERETEEKDWLLRYLVVY